MAEKNPSATSEYLEREDLLHFFQGESLENRKKVFSSICLIQDAELEGQETDHAVKKMVVARSLELKEKIATSRLERQKASDIKRRKD